LVEGWLVDTPPIHFQLALEVVPKLTIKQLRSVSNTVNPFAGDAMALRSVVVIFGNFIPCVVLLSSKTALELGLLVPMPICDHIFEVKLRTSNNRNTILFFIFFYSITK
jgi:hypothetical protein